MEYLMRVSLFLCALFLLGLGVQAESIDFNRDVRPILSDRCFHCHGPDVGNRKAGLRLDVREAALKLTDSGLAAILPDHPEESEVIAKVLSDDAELVMSPPKSKLTLTTEEKVTLQQVTDLAGKTEDYEFEWWIAPPSDGSSPKIYGTTTVNLLSVTSPDPWHHLRFPLPGDEIAAKIDEILGTAASGRHFIELGILGRALETVVTDVQRIAHADEMPAHFVGERTRSRFQLPSLLRHFQAVLIGAGLEADGAAHLPLKAGDDIGGNRLIGVADMRLAIGVANGGGDIIGCRHSGLLPETRGISSGNCA